MMLGSVTNMLKRWGTDMNRTVTIPQGMVPVSQGEADRILEKQWRARIAMKCMPVARILNEVQRMLFARKIEQEQERTPVLMRKQAG